MAHFTRAQPFGTWVSGYVFIPADFQSFDARCVAAIDGDCGGSWAPSSGINIAGAGLQLTGPLIVAFSGALVSGAGSGFNCEDGDVPILGAGHPGDTSTILYSFATAAGVPAQCWKTRNADIGLQSFFPSNDSNDGNGQQPVHAIYPFRPVDGSTLSQLVITFHVPTVHPNLPASMPRVRVWRSDAFGNVVFLTSIAAGASADGYINVPRPTSAAIWSNGGAIQTLIVPCDQNNIIDIGHYAYTIELVDEFYGTVTWPFAGFTTPTNAALTAKVWAPSTVYNINDIILPTPTNQTGFVYVVTAGGTSGSTEPIWTNVPFAPPPAAAPPAAQLTVTDNTVTLVQGGAVFSFSAATLTNCPPGGYGLKGWGTVWHSARATYQGIVDTRFQ